VVLNGDPEHRYVGNLNFSFAYVEGESLLMVRLHVQPLSFWSSENVCCGGADSTSAVRHTYRCRC
jgi:cysteine sulfinate desulfinase/cysteine desulfurase-like protein